MTARGLIVLAVAAAVLAGCGTETATPAPDRERSTRLVDTSLQPPWITALDVDPGTGDLLLGTNKGFWRIEPEGGRITRIRGRIAHGGRTDTVGTFLEVEPLEPDRWVGSGHPDNEDTLPQFLGLIETTDQGRTWRSVSRMGDADLHKIVQAHGRLYAFDAVLGAMLISSDGGRTFEERFTPRGLVTDFVVDPEDPEYLLAATEDGLYRTNDGGRGWRAVEGVRGARLVWPEPARLVRAEADGTVAESTNRGATYRPIGRVPGEPHRFEETDNPRHLYLALSDGTIVETRDGGRNWKVVFKP